MSQQLKIDALSSEGDGIGTLENGMKIFVPGALPGERVSVEVVDLKKNFAKGRLISIVAPSVDRKAPECPLFGTCGGCQIMHLSYEKQLEVKQSRVVESLRRIGGIESAVEACRPSPEAFNYRNKIQLPVVWEKEGMKIGLYRRESHEIIPIEKCFIQASEGEKILHEVIPILQDVTSLRTLLIRTAKHTREALVIVVTNGTQNLKSLGKAIAEKLPQVKGVVENINCSPNNVILGRERKTLAGVPFLHEKLLNKLFKISPGAFFQVNTLQAENLFSEAIALAEITSQDCVWDAYCGVGTLALLASDYAREVVGTESFPQAIDDAHENARLNNIKNTKFMVGRAEVVVQTLPHPNVVFLNPPRKGCDPKLLSEIIEKKINRIVYISCDPATLSRDLKIFYENGYDIKRVVPFDMFPQTMHVETVAQLTRLHVS